LKLTSYLRDKSIVAKKSKKNKRKKAVSPKRRNAAALIAKMRNSAGAMKPRNQKRKNRNSWRKEIDLDTEV